MREIDARVTGFDYSAYHAYTTEVEVDGRTWSLGIRYSTFFEFYTSLMALEKHFTVTFPPKGGLFFSPPPEERQEQLNEFLMTTLAYFDMRGHPKRMEALLNELLQIPQHLGFKEDDEDRTASEGSSVAEELLLDTPMPTHHLDESFDEDKGVIESLNLEQFSPDKVDHELRSTATKTEAMDTEFEEKPKIVTQVTPSQQSEEKDLLSEHEQFEDMKMKAILSILNEVIEAVVVTAMKQDFEQAKVVETRRSGKGVAEVHDVTKDLSLAQTSQIEEEPVYDLSTERLVAVAEIQLLDSDTNMSSSTAAEETDACESEDLAADVVDESICEITTNPVVSWFRRIGAFGQYAAEMTENVLCPEEEVDNEAKVREKAKANEARAKRDLKFETAAGEAMAKMDLEAKAFAAEEKAKRDLKAKAAAAEAQAKLDCEAKAVAAAELLRAEQEHYRRTEQYRYPIFFQPFNCDENTLRFSMSQRSCDCIAF
ncbi:hypothetical protein CCR75_007208 [Bremia lactucae]|uniref:PX domain-containing protein n=1 Tax=Bremia lactucae TaxID=4779 RepID=A0A976FJS9_BRELC|nr:hypothetical protein CCR75_007208 [Bremia lactucae]